MVRVFVPASIGNVGPGFDVLGLEVPGLGDTYTLELIDGPSQVGSISGIDANVIPKDPTKNCTIIAAEALLRSVGNDHGVQLKIERNLPIGGGLGSSASASVGGALGAAKLIGKESDKKLVMTAALAGESFVAGRHLDNIAPSLLGGLCIAESTDPVQVTSIPILGEWWVAVVTPNVQLSTAEMRQSLPNSLETGIWTKQMANAIGVSVAFQTDDKELLGRSLKDLFAEPARSVFIERYQDIRQAALNAGAIGSTISGSGPTLFSICATQSIANKVVATMSKAAGDVRCQHVAKLEKKGAAIL